MMIRRITCILAVCALAFTGCDKIKKLTGMAKKEEPVAAATPAATPIATPTPEATPEPRVTIDRSAEVVVLCYHRIEGKAGGALSIEPAEFERQMQAIKDAGLEVISMQDFLAWRRGEKNIPPKSVLITIDDGYVSGYDVGWPILKKYGYPFTMFVYLNYINSGGKSISWTQLEEMRDAGVEIGSHTVSHQDLRKKAPKAQFPDYESWLKDEVERSKQVLEQKLGIRVATFAYPFGLHNEKVHAACKAAGYEAAFSTYGQRLGYDSAAMTLGRYDVTTKDVRGHSSFDVGISFQGMKAPGATEGVLGQDAAVSMVTKPMNGDTVTETRPEISANLATMGAIEPETVQLRIAGIGLVPSKYDAATKMLTCKPAQDLRPGPVTVLVSAQIKGRKVEARWTFTVAPAP